MSVNSMFSAEKASKTERAVADLDGEKKAVLGRCGMLSSIKAKTRSFGTLFPIFPEVPAALDAYDSPFTIDESSMVPSTTTFCLMLSAR